MITFTYTWKIPANLVQNFVTDWEELTLKNKTKYGSLGAKLFQLENDDIISIANWPDTESWQQWKNNDENHEYRVKWREYRVSGLKIIKTLSDI